MVSSHTHTEILLRALMEILLCDLIEILLCALVEILLCDVMEILAEYCTQCVCASVGDLMA